MEFRVLVSDNVHDAGIDIFRNTDGFQVDVKQGLSPEELKAVIGQYHALVIRSATKVTADVLAEASELKVIGRAGAGLDNVDLSEATRRGIAVMNTPGENSVAAAEHTIGLIMAMHRHLPQAVASMKEGRWDKKKYQGREMAGKTLGVVGLGKIGSHVARLASRGLKMKVLAYDPAVTADAALQFGATLTTLDDLIAESDVVSLHVPLKDGTRNLIDREAIAKMKDSVMIVNAARGGIIDEDALLAGLESGKIAAAGLDVFSVQPPGDRAVVMHPKVTATPHLGASTTEAQINVAVAVARQIVDYLRDGIVRNAVNAPAVVSSEFPRLSPYMELSERLGRFIGSLVTGTITEMEVEYHGELATWDFEPITNAAVAGLLSNFEEDEVNQVNASFLAGNRGIRVSQTTRHERKDHASSVIIRTVCTEASTRSVEGTLIHREALEPRIISIDGFVTEAVPAGPMLVITNRDIPGMICGITHALAARSINIAQMNLSRDRPGGTALSIVNIDEPADDETLDNIRNVAGVLTVHQCLLKP